MILDITRKWETNQSTISEFKLRSTHMGGLSVCNGFFLEPPGPDSVTPNKNLRIPEGEYSLQWHYSKKYGKVPILSNDQVALGRAILIHQGNYPQDTLGCLLAGSTHARDFVGNSRSKLAELISELEKADISKVIVEITNQYEV